MTKTTYTSQYRVCLLFESFEFLSFAIVSFFGFRASDLKFFISYGRANHFRPGQRARL